MTPSFLSRMAWVFIGIYLNLFAINVAASTSFEIPNSHVHTIHSKALNRTYDLYIKLPKGYTDPQNSARTYPSIYLNDGPYTFQVAAGVTHLPISSGRFSPSILVGISYSQGENGMFSRVRDLTPVKDQSWVKFETGEALNYLTFIESEVIPFVETHYRAAPNYRTLAGQSLGGSFGVLALLTKPQLFENYILTSPSLWIHDRYLFELEKQFAAKNTELKAKIYFATGAMETPANGSKNDMVGLQNAFVAKLRSRNYSSLEVKDDIIEDAYHETTFPIGFTKGALWLYGMNSQKQ